MAIVVTVNDKVYNLNKKQLINKGEYINEVIYRAFAQVDEDCAICYEGFTCEDDEPAFLSCACHLTFHRKCVEEILAKFKQCPQCRRKNVTITTFKGHINNAQAYEEIYDKAKEILSGDEWLYFINNWKMVIDQFNRFNRSICVKLYDYMDYTRFGFNWNSNPIYVKSGIKFYVNKMTDRIFSVGEQTIKPRSEFDQIFDEETQGIFRDLGKVKNVIIAGGLIAKIVMVQITKIPETADIDFYVYGPDNRERDIALHNLLAYISGKFGPNKVYYAQFGAVILIFPEGYKRSIQIICGAFYNPDHILTNFDLDHVRIAYDGKDVICLPQFLNSCRYQLSQIDDDKFSNLRVLKAKEYDINILSSKIIGDSMDYIKPYNNNITRINSNTSEGNAKRMISDTYKIPIERVTTNYNDLLKTLQTSSDFIRKSYGINNSTIFNYTARNINFETFKLSRKFNGTITYHSINYIILELNGIKPINSILHNNCQIITVDDKTINPDLVQFINKVLAVISKQIKRNLVIGPKNFMITNKTKFWNDHRRDLRREIILDQTYNALITFPRIDHYNGNLMMEILDIRR